MTQAARHAARKTLIKGVILALATASALLPSLPAEGVDIESLKFWVECTSSHRLPDDPIVFPNEPGASHSHDFSGNPTTDAYSTPATLRAATETTCGFAADEAAYWHPTVYVDGASVLGLRVTVYYRIPSDVSPATLVPRNLEAIGGDSHATRPTSPRETRWFCGGGSPLADHPYDCTDYVANRGGDTAIDGVTPTVEFPNCWDGVSRKWDSGAHLVYQSYGRACPASHPYALPRISIRFHTGILDPCPGRVCTPATPWSKVANRTNLTLASGPFYTWHGDFVNTWRQAVLDDLVTTCFGVDPRPCGLQGDFVSNT